MKRIQQIIIALLALLVTTIAGAANPYYSHTSGVPATGSAASSSVMRAEFDSVASGFNLLPTLSGNNNLPIFVDGTGSLLQAISAASARTNLGLGTMATVNSPAPIANGGTGAGDAATARTNLGVTATGADTTYAYRANNLSDLANAATARSNLSAAKSGANTDITSIALQGLADLSNAAAGQIKFPSTQNPSADPNTLDDYKEGTWTPSVGGTATYTTQNGFYTKIGRLVTLHFQFQINIIGTGSTTTISGIPFAAANVGTADGFFGNVGSWTSLSISVSSIACQIQKASSSMTFTFTAGSTSSSTGPIFQNGSGVWGTITYITN